MTLKLLVIDNYDSFTYNLVQMFSTYNIAIHVHRNDQITLDEIADMNPDYILISPGPKNPANSGISIQVISSFCEKIPILGVCLGMQCINEVFGGATVRSPEPIHGKTSMINHSGQYLFKNIPEPFAVARYHSLMVKTNQGTLVETACSQDGVIMGLSHPEFPLHGVQFHPESFLTQKGQAIIKNYLELGPWAE